MNKIKVVLTTHNNFELNLLGLINSLHNYDVSIKLGTNKFYFLSNQKQNFVTKD